jgi:tetratricopeptide (TPR) repeat protein
LPLAERYRALAPLIADPVKAVRLEVASALSEVPLREMPPAEAAALARLFEEMLAAERLFLDRPESHYNIANHLAQQGDFLGAERNYRAALARDETFVPAYVNLAELQRAAGSETLAMATLRRGLAAVPDGAALHYALGLALYRQDDKAAALVALAEAARLAPDDATYGYGHALALREAGEGEAAIAALRRVLLSHPNDRTTLYALVAFLAEDGGVVEALAHARHLAALEPEDPAIADLLRRLGG